MALVLFGHAIEMFFVGRADHLFNLTAFAIWRAIYGFHMSAFFMVAGMARRNLSEKPALKIAREMLALIIFAYLVHVLGWSGDALVVWNLQGHLIDVKMLTDPLIGGHGFFIVVMWFLVALAWILGAAYLLVGRFHWGIKLAVVAAAIWCNVELRAGTNYMMLKSVLPGLGFFLIGMGLQAQYFRSARAAFARIAGWSARWMWLALLPVAVWLAPFNHGCRWSFSTVCSSGFDAGFVVMLVNGRTGFLPLFLAAGLAGSMALLSLARLLMTAPRLGRLMAWYGQHTIELLVANGVVLCLIEPSLADRLAAFPGHGEVILIPLGLTLAQFVLLPIYGPMVRWLWQAVVRCVGVATDVVLKKITGVFAG